MGIEKSELAKIAVLDRTEDVVCGGILGEKLTSPEYKLFAIHLWHYLWRNAH